MPRQSQKVSKPFGIFTRSSDTSEIRRNIFGASTSVSYIRQPEEYHSAALAPSRKMQFRTVNPRVSQKGYFPLNSQRTASMSEPSFSEDSPGPITTFSSRRP